MAWKIKLHLKRSDWLALVPAIALFTFATTPLTSRAQGQQSASNATRPANSVASSGLARPKLVVLLVVDQMRGDYVDKFLPQWTGGLRRLVEEAAWFPNAAYPYSATQTCVGHSTISTGSFPSSHGMVMNAWWDRDSQKMVTCTADPNTKNLGYAGVTPKGGDSAWRMQIPSFAEELKFQGSGGTRVVTFSLKARAAITLAGHKADAVTWAEGTGWVTSSVFGTVPFIEEFVKAHPVKEDYGKTWNLSLPRDAYWYAEKPLGGVPPPGWTLTFPHSLRGKDRSSEPDAAFYDQWAASPYADAYLIRLAETAVDSLSLGQRAGTDFLGISFSSLDHIGHALGPHSWEVQDLLVRLDKDLAGLFAHLDEKLGPGNYLVALSGDHGVPPTPEDLATTGVDSGVLHLPELQERVDKALEPFNLGKPAVARIYASDLYFASGVYDKLKRDEKAMAAAIDAARSQPGVAEILRAEQIRDRPPTHSPLRNAFALGYFPGRSGDLFIVPKPYWILDATPTGKPRPYGAEHGAPYYYDQHVPVLLMGYGIQKGKYLREVTPADIAPTLATLCGVSLVSRDGLVLAEALAKLPQ